MLAISATARSKQSLIPLKSRGRGCADDAQPKENKTNLASHQRSSPCLRTIGARNNISCELCYQLVLILKINHACSAQCMEDSHFQQKLPRGARLDGRVAAAKDVDRLARVGVAEHDVMVVHMVLHHPLAIRLARRPCESSRRLRWRPAAGRGRLACICTYLSCLGYIRA